MKAVLFYGVKLPLQLYEEDGSVRTDYEFIFDENFVGSEWQFHCRQTVGRSSAYLCLSRLTTDTKAAEPFLLISPKGLAEKKMKNDEREELKDILKSLGVTYKSPKWFLTASE